MEREVARAIKERYGTSALRDAALTEAAGVRSSPGRLEHFAKAISEIERGLKGIDDDLNRVRRAARRGEIELATFEELRADAEAERAELLSRKAELEATLAESQTAEHSLAEWQGIMGRVDLWDELDVASQREILYGLLRSVVIFKPRGSGQAPVIDLEWETM